MESKLYYIKIFLKKPIDLSFFLCKRGEKCWRKRRDGGRWRGVVVLFTTLPRFLLEDECRVQCNSRKTQQQTKQRKNNQKQQQLNVHS